jgi:uncharacterized repeat protein (TIGR04138 family)
MPPPPPPLPPDPPKAPPLDYETALRQVVAAVGTYPLEAYLFVNDGVAYTVKKTHGVRKDKKQNMHITGAQLCAGLRELALQRWGMLAATVLARWGIRSTADFGQIVFAMVENDLMSKQDEDRPEEFADAFDFATAFDPAAYVIPPRA